MKSLRGFLLQDRIFNEKQEFKNSLRLFRILKEFCCNWKSEKVMREIFLYLTSWRWLRPKIGAFFSSEHLSLSCLL